jgi:hypothetical protein
MKSLWEQNLDLDIVEQKAKRKLEEQFNTVFTEKEELFSFLKSWEDAIEKENIAKITYRRKQWDSVSEDLSTQSQEQATQQPKQTNMQLEMQL